MALSTQQRDTQIRRYVEERFPGGTLAEYPEEKITQDNNAGRDWFISEMTTQPGIGPLADPATEVKDRGMTRRPAMSNFPLSEHFCTEAYEDRGDNICVPRQIAQVRKKALVRPGV